jgi:hypothetical protein
MKQNYYFISLNTTFPIEPYTLHKANKKGSSFLNFLLCVAGTRVELVTSGL